MNKRQKYREVASFDLEDCSLDEMLTKFQNYKKMFPFENLQISYDTEFEYEGPNKMSIFYINEETDEEYTLRIEYEREQLETKERKEMDRLSGYKKLNASNQIRLTELLEKYKNE